MNAREYFAIPTKCPECGSPLEMNGEYLLCTGKEQCPAQVSGAVKRWISKLGILHFGDALIDLLCESGRVNTIADLYRLDAKDVALMDMGGRRVGGTADKAFSNLHKRMAIPLHDFVGSLGIPLIGRSMAKTIIDAGFGSLMLMSRAKVSEIAAIPGMGETKAIAFCDGFWDLLDKNIIQDLLAVGVTIERPKDGALKGMSFCMTGFRDNALEAALEAAGGALKSSVGKNLSVLVCKDPNSNSDKMKKARGYGVEVIGIDEAWARFGGKP